jgi:5-methylcytosine-specific restriction endonuclease McrA
MTRHNPYDKQHRILRALVLAEAGYVCAYCGGKATEADHVVEVVNGGTNTKDNYVAACKRCNARRGQRMTMARRAARHFTTSRRW